MKHKCHNCDNVANGEFLLIGPCPPYHGPDLEVFLCDECNKDDDEPSKDDAKFDAAWRREQAMEAGMLYGCEAYNDYC